MPANIPHVRCLPPHVGTVTLAQAVTYLACGRLLSSGSLRRLRRLWNRRPSEDIQGKLKDAANKLEDAANKVMIMLMRGDVSALGNRQQDDNPPSSDREPIPVAFLRDSAWADPFTDSIMTDWLHPHHFAGRVHGFKHVRLDRDAFFRAIEASVPAPAVPSIQRQEVNSEPKKTRTRPIEEEALQQNRIEGILAIARRLDPKHRERLRTLAAKIAANPAWSQGYAVETIRQILSGTYRPMKRHGIRGLHQRPATKLGDAG